MRKRPAHGRPGGPAEGSAWRPQPKKRQSLSCSDLQHDPRNMLGFGTASVGGVGPRAASRLSGKAREPLGDGLGWSLMGLECVRGKSRDPKRGRSPAWLDQKGLFCRSFWALVKVPFAGHSGGHSGGSAMGTAPQDKTNSHRVLRHRVSVWRPPPQLSRPSVVCPRRMGGWEVREEGRRRGSGSVSPGLCGLRSLGQSSSTSATMGMAFSASRFSSGHFTAGTGTHRWPARILDPITPRHVRVMPVTPRHAPHDHQPKKTTQ